MSSPGFSRVRVLYGSESGSGSETDSGPGFAVCRCRPDLVLAHLSEFVALLIMSRNF